MKFSEKKKAKMRKQRQKRIKYVCGYMYGFKVDDGYEVIDQAKIKDQMYLLTKKSNNIYAIYKIVDVCDYVKLSPKRILQNKTAFSNHDYWKRHSTIEITADGQIKSAKLGTIRGPYNAKTSSNYRIIEFYF